MSVIVPSAGDEGLASWAAGVAHHVNGASITAATGNISTTQTQVVGLTIPADVLEAGSTYRLSGWGIASNSGASVRALTLRCRIGPTTLTGNIAGSRAPNIVTAASADGFLVEFLFTVRTAGASGTCIANGVTIGEAAVPFNTQTFVGADTSTVAVDTTVINILELTAVTAHAEGTVNFLIASIERVA